jgi:hypothetical protein
MNFVKTRPLFRPVAPKPSLLLLLSLLLAPCLSGCGGSEASGKTSTGTVGNQTSAPVIPQGWTTLDRSYVSFAYPPTGYTVAEDTSAVPKIQVSDGKNDLVFVEFQPGFENSASATQQCAGVITQMKSLIDAAWGAYETPSNKYPQTVMQQLGITTGGNLGGAVENINFTTYAALGSQPVPAGSFQVQGVPRAGGLYLVVVGTPDTTPASEQLLNQFLDSIDLKSDPLASTAYCNYQG